METALRIHFPHLRNGLTQDAAWYLQGIFRGGNDCGEITAMRSLAPLFTKISGSKKNSLKNKRCDLGLMSVFV